MKPDTTSPRATHAFAVFLHFGVSFTIWVNLVSLPLARRWFPPDKGGTLRAPRIASAIEAA